MDYIAQPKDYWIAPNAINITRNALGKPNRIQCSVASGAAILCYIEGVDGLGYDNGHRFRTWPLTISPTYFNSNTEKYVYVAIPRTSSVGTQAVVVFPSEKLDIYGVNESDVQVGSTDYYYIWLQGILTATNGTSNREWQQAIDFGKKGTDEDLYDDTSSDWYQYSKVNNVVTFLKNIRMKAGTTFQNLILGYKELTGVATSDTAYTDSDALVTTPGYVESQYLSKTHESTAQEQISFLKGLWVKARGLFGFDAEGNAKVNDLDVAGGANVKGEQGLKIGTFNSGLLGTGAMIAPSGHAEFESIYSRSFISTPEFRFNRISVTEGEQWCTNGYGTIESVVVGKDENGNDVQNGGLITLHLEENDFASVDVGDICRGIYNDIANIYETATVEDDKVMAAGTSQQEGSGIGFPAKAGFFTSYFYIARMVKNVRGECQFIYGLRKSTTPHPCAFMKFAQYGSFTNSARRASSYSSSVNHAYEMRLQGVSTWQIQTANIVSREGWLGDLTIEMADHTQRTLQGYGLYVQDNVYFGNAVIQLDPYTIDMLERELATYKADFSEYIDMIVVDDTGNVIGGLWTDTEQQGGTTERSYRIHSAISVRKSGVLLTEAAADADAGTGTYKLYVSPVNCTCIVENSTIYITGIDHIKDGVAGTPDDANFDYDAMRAMESCRVDIVIDCEGRTSLSKTLPINIKHDSEPYVGADITNEFSAVSWNTKNQAYIGLPITFDMKMWHNNEGLDIASVNDVSVTPAVTGMTVSKAIATLANGQKVARITISELPESLPLVQELNVTSAATYAGVSYERTLVHTINKSTDTNVYSLIPSVSEVMLDKNAGTLNINTVDCDVFCDSSDNKHYEVVYANFGTHEIGLYYKKFYTDGTSDASETEYAGTAISINTSVKEVVFYLYKKVGATVDRTVKHDQEGVPVIAEGQDGKGVEYIFITKQSWDGTDADKPTIYDVAADRQVDNYCPYTDAQHSAQWTDEPTGVGANMRWEFQAMRKKINGVWQPFGDVKYKDHYVVDGVTPYAIDLSNEQSQIACDENGGVVGNYETSRLMLFKGTSYAFTDFAITITPQNISCNGSASAFTLTDAQKTAAQSAGYFELTPSAITADSATISVSAVYGNVTLVAVYRINKSYAGKDSVIYSLQTSLDTIRKDKNGSLVDQTLTLQVKKTVGATATFITTYAGLQEGGLSLTYDNAGATGTSLAAMSISTATFVGTNGTWGKMNLIKNSVIVDAERINVVTDGADGISISSANVWYALSDSNTSVADSLFTHDSFPTTLNEGYYVWEATKVVKSDGTSALTAKMCLGATTDFLSGTEVYAINTNSSTPPDNNQFNTSYNKTKGYYLWTATRVQYTDLSYGYLNKKCVGYWGEDGTSPYFADIDNEMDSVACNNSGNTTAAYDTYIGVHVWHGSTEETLTKLQASSITGFTITPDATNKRIRIQVASDTQIEKTNTITITVASANSGDKTLHFVLNGVRAGAGGNNAVLYSLNPTASQIVKLKGGGTEPSTNISCTVIKTDGDSRSEVTTGFTLKTIVDGMEAQSSTVNPANVNTSIVYELRIGTTLVDKETIPVVTDGEDGDNGGYYEKESCRSSSREYYGSGYIDQSYGTSGWGSLAPQPTDSYPYIWERTRWVNPNTTPYTYGSWSYVCLTGATGGIGATGRMYYPAGEYNTSKQYYVTSETCPVVMCNNLYWYAKKNVPAGEYTPPNNEYWGQFSNFQAIFVEILFANFAKLGSFVISGDWFISQYGVLKQDASTTINNSTSYQNFKTNDPTATGSHGYPCFAPNLALNALTGKTYMNDASIKGRFVAENSKGKWEIEPDMNGLFAAPHISGYKKNGNLGMRMIFDADPDDYSEPVDGGGVYLYGNTYNFQTWTGEHAQYTFKSWLISNGDTYMTAYTNGVEPYIHAVSKSNAGDKDVYIGVSSSYGMRLSASHWPSEPQVSDDDMYVDVNGYMKVKGMGAQMINIKTSNFTLPDYPPLGTIFIIKGCTVTTQSAPILNGDSSAVLVAANSSYDFGNVGVLLYYLGSTENKWGQIYSY